MRVTAWNNGGSTFGIKIGKGNRDEFFSPDWKEIEVEMDGTVRRFFLRPGFWKDCPEFRDRGQPLIKEWLERHRELPWPKNHPPKAELTPQGQNRFRLLP